MEKSTWRKAHDKKQFEGREFEGLHVMKHPSLVIPEGNNIWGYSISINRYHQGHKHEAAAVILSFFQEERIQKGMTSLGAQHA